MLTAIVLFAAALAATPLTAAEEDGYFDLSRPYVEERSRLDSFDLMAPRDPEKKCAKGRALVAHDAKTLAAQGAYLEDLQAKGRPIDTLLTFYLLTALGEARAEVNARTDCAYDDVRADDVALAWLADSLLADMPAAPATKATPSLSDLRAILTRDLWLDEVVMSVEMLRDAKAQSPEATALIARLDTLKAEREAARRQKTRDLDPHTDAPELEAIMRRQLERSIARR